LPNLGTLPIDIPTNPHRTYKDSGWNGFGDWLGTGFISWAERQYQPFMDAREYVQKLGLKSKTEWTKMCRGQLIETAPIPKDIPLHPDNHYKDHGWISWGDWLGTGQIASRLRRYRRFEDARNFARRLGLRSNAEWRSFCKGGLPDKGTLPGDIPAFPSQTYKDKGWQGIGDWLGTFTIATRKRRYRPFEEARAYIRSLGLKNRSEWKLFCTGGLIEKGRLPDDIPSNPNRTYGEKGWIDITDWLGTDKKANSKIIHS
jgi:hypothetical protein